MRGATHLGVVLALVLASAALSGCGHYGSPQRASQTRTSDPASPAKPDGAQPGSGDAAECEDPAASAETQP
jgi:hypothetical protein